MNRVCENCNYFESLNGYINIDGKCNLTFPPVIQRYIVVGDILTFVKKDDTCSFFNSDIVIERGE